MDKQTANEAALSPTRPFVLGDAVYALRPPTLADLAAIGSQARKRIQSETPLAALVNDPSFKLLPVAAQVEAAKIAAQAQVSGSRPLDGMAMADALFEPDALAFAIWCCARPQHPDLKLETIRKEISQDNAAEVFVAFNEASGMVEMEKNALAGPSLSPLSGTGGPWSEGSAKGNSQR